MGKAKVWGYEKCPGAKFTRHKFGRNKVYVKIPNVFNIQRLILARRLMYMDQPGVYHDMMKDPINHMKKFENLRKRSLFRRTPFCYRFNNRKRKISVNVKALPTTNEQRGYFSEVEFNFDDLSYKNCKKSSALLETINARQKYALPNNQYDWHHRKWQMRACQDVTSNLMNEIVNNSRMLSYENSVFAGLIRYQPSTIILLESARLAFMRHDWKMTLRYLICLIRSYPLHPHKVMPSIIWNMGLLVIVNHGINSIERVKEFAITLKPLLKDEPTWLSVQVGLWLIQKGYFVDGFSYIDTCVNNLSFFHTWAWNNQSVMNPKRDLTNFIVELIQAVRLYYVWKQTSISNQAGDLDADIMELDDDEQESTRYGGYALNSFEDVYYLSTIVEADVMCFLEPFIELLVKYRSLDDAKHVVRKIYRENYGNKFVEEFYVKFTEKNFPDDCGSDLFKFQKQRLGQHTTVQTKRNWKNSKLKFDRLRALKKKSETFHQFEFVKIPNPAFSL